MNKISLIAAREFKFNVTRWPFWLVTLGLPLLLVLIGVLSVAVTLLSGTRGFKLSNTQTPATIAIYDESGIYHWEPTQDPAQTVTETPLTELLGDLQLSPTVQHYLEKAWAKSRGPTRKYPEFPSWEAAQAEVRANRAMAALHIPNDFATTHQLDLLLYDPKAESRLRSLRNLLRDGLLTHLYGKDLSQQLLDPLEGHISYLNPTADAQTVAANKTIPLNPSATSSETEAELTSSGKNKKSVGTMVMAIFYCMLMMLTILTSTDRMLRGLVEEKSNRVIELLLSSVTADQLMAGKAIGLCLVGMLQLAIWMGLVFLPGGFLFAFLSFNLFHMLVIGLTFVLGYLLLASLMLGFGSLGNNIQEANQFSAIFGMITILPMMTLPMLVQQPSGAIAQWLTFIPFTSSLAVVTRLACGSIQLWEIGLALLGQFLAVIVVLKFCAKLFRAGILMTGKPPNPLVLWRIIRSA